MGFLVRFTSSAGLVVASLALCAVPSRVHACTVASGPLLRSQKVPRVGAIVVGLAPCYPGARCVRSSDLDVQVWDGDERLTGEVLVLSDDKTSGGLMAMVPDELPEVGSELLIQVMVAGVAPPVLDGGLAEEETQEKLFEQDALVSAELGDNPWRAAGDLAPQLSLSVLDGFAGDEACCSGRSSCETCIGSVSRRRLVLALDSDWAESTFGSDAFDPQFALRMLEQPDAGEQPDDATRGWATYPNGTFVVFDEERDEYCAALEVMHIKTAEVVRTPVTCVPRGDVPAPRTRETTLRDIQRWLDETQCTDAQPSASEIACELGLDCNPDEGGCSLSPNRERRHGGFWLLLASGALALRFRRRGPRSGA